MKEFICITCPRGCHLSVDEKTLKVTGNTCPRGEKYGIDEVTNPKRMVTSTVKIKGADLNRLPVKTDKPIRKDLMLDVMKELDKIEVKAPITRGTVIVKNVCQTDVNIIACRDM